MRRFRILAVLLLVTAGGAACRQAAEPTPVVETVDVLDFLIGDATLWPRIGALYMNQIVDQPRQEVCWVKYGNPRRFECWRWDSQFIYHETDNAVDGDTGESYHFTDGRWMPRRVPVMRQPEWRLDVAANRLVWYTPQCTVDAARSTDFPYHLRAWFEPQVDGGGDVGVRDNIVLEYAPYDPASGRSNPERFYFAKGAGWYRWEGAGTDQQFNRRFSRVILMNREVWCTGTPQ